MPGSGHEKAPRIRFETGGRAPVVDLQFERTCDDPADGRSFAPFRMPDLAQITFRDVGPRALRRLDLETTASLVPGIHEFPIADGPGFRVEVQPDTRAGVRVQAGPPREGDWDAGPVVHAVDIEIAPAVRLVNVVETLAEVRRVVEPESLGTLRELADGPFGRLLGKIGFAALEAMGLDAVVLRGGGDAGRLLGTWLAAQVEGFGRRLTAGNLEAGEIRLAGATARPRWLPDERRWELAFRFSGHVVLANRVEHPFWDVELPRAVLPVLHATLEHLLTATPLSGARLATSRMDAAATIRALAGLVRRVEGTCRATVDLPEVSLRARLVDRTQLAWHVGVPEGCAIEASFLAERARDTWTLEVPQARLLPAHGPGGLSLGGAGTFRLDLAMPDRPVAQMLSGSGRLEIGPGATWPELALRFEAGHPLTDLRREVQARLLDATVAGGVDIDLPRRGRARVLPRDGGLSLEARIRVAEQPVVTGAPLGLEAACDEGRFRAALSHGDGTWIASFQGDAALRARIQARVRPLPELRITDSLLRAALAGRLAFDLSARLAPDGDDGAMALAPSGTASLTLDEARVDLDGRRIAFPPGATLAAGWRAGAIHREGLGSAAFDLRWDLLGREVMIHGPAGSASILTSALRQGEVTLHLSPGGRFGISGARDGTYGARFFNALLDPAGDPARLLDLLESQDALSHIVSVLRMFNPELADDLSRARRWILEFRDHLQGHGIRRPGDAVPRERLVRLISRLLVGDESLGPRLEPLVRDVTEARGLDVDRARLLILEALPGTDADYEIGALLRWLAGVTAPGDPVASPHAASTPPIHQDPRFADALAGAPSAADLYALAQRAQIPAVRQVDLAALATDLSLAQIDYVLRRCGDRLKPPIAARLRHVRDAKRAVARVEQGWGGLAFAGQSAWIAGFLGEAIGPLPELDPAGASWPAPCALGAYDVAVLLQAGLAETHQGLQAQINNRMLIDLLRQRPAEFTRQVLVEMGHQSPRILAGVLLAFLHQDQDRMRRPVDLAAFLQQRLGRPVPRLDDFMAGGCRVRDSYYQELTRLAEAVFEDAMPYLARRALLREVQHPVPGPAVVRGTAARTARDARAAIESADRAAAGIAPTRGASSRRAAPVVRAYRDAFQACAAFLQAHPLGFQQDWFKAFWRRNDEALKVLSVVRAWQEDQDQVREWLSLVAPGRAPRGQADLVRTVIDVLYADAPDRARIADDPLVGLLIDPEPGRYDVTVISAMGVITDGADGRELEDAYARLAERRGVRVVRAHTGLLQSLEYNAAAIIRALDGVDGPWGWVGYSQGCANALLAESFLRGGTPDQQKVLDRLVCRNLLFSAANGSAHGTSGTAKFARAMIDGERFLKHYQARYSKEMIDLFLRVFRMLLDSRLFVSYLGGAHSLTLERAAALHRDGQFADWVPTSTTRGVVAPDRVPEALESLYWAHRHLIGCDRSDTQVLDADAVGHATRVANERTAVLARCDMGSAVQATHHWSPLSREVEPVTTDRDRRLGIYLGPKDRHVFPWLDVNARFGRIRVIR
jgi:hypothetical protein